MELLEVIDSALQKYDLLTVLLVGGLYMWFRKKLELVHKDVRTVDSAVNNRPLGSMTMSQEVSEIHRKVDVQANELNHVKEDVMFLKSDLTKSRIYNMERFEEIEKNIVDVKKEVCTKKRTSTKS
jgi:hypothetical protein